MGYSKRAVVVSPTMVWDGIVASVVSSLASGGWSPRAVSKSRRSIEHRCVAVRMDRTLSPFSTAEDRESSAHNADRNFSLVGTANYNTGNILPLRIDRPLWSTGQRQSRRTETGVRQIQELDGHDGRSCFSSARGGHESWIPNQSTAGGIFASMVAIQVQRDSNYSGRG
jgi:hypothetical protein